MLQKAVVERRVVGSSGRLAVGELMGEGESGGGDIGFGLSSVINSPTHRMIRLTVAEWPSGRRELQKSLTKSLSLIGARRTVMWVSVGGFAL